MLRQQSFWDVGALPAFIRLALISLLSGAHQKRPHTHAHRSQGMKLKSIWKLPDTSPNNPLTTKLQLGPSGFPFSESNVPLRLENL
jgi:hypothetical protein